MLRLIGSIAAAYIVERFLASGTGGAVLAYAAAAGGVTWAGLAELGIVTAAAGFSAYQGNESLENSRRMKNAQDNLERQRAKQLADEAASREAAAARAKTVGQRVGAGGRSSFLGNLGFGSGNSTTTGGGVGNGALFGQ